MIKLKTRKSRLLLVAAVIWILLSASFAQSEAARLSIIAHDAKLNSCLTYTHSTMCDKFAELDYNRTYGVFWQIWAAYILVPFLFVALTMGVWNWIQKGSPKKTVLSNGTGSPLG